MKGSKVFKIGSIVLVVLGIICLIIKAITPEYVDSEGILQEYFFLLPIGFGLIFLSLISIVIYFILKKLKK